MQTEPDDSQVGDQSPLNPSPPTLADRKGATRRRWSWFSFLMGVLATSLVFAVVSGGNGGPDSVRPPDETQIFSATPSSPIDLTTGAETFESSMDEVLSIAEDSLLHMFQNLDDYTATLVKQETVGGVLTEPTEMALKVMCTHRGGNVDESEPMRVYLRFLAPAGLAGREVIWAKDLHDGKLVVHEAGFLGLVTLRLDPAGMIAMRGQRYPIYEIGLTKLVQKLIQRGEVDRTNPDVWVTIKRGIQWDGMVVDLITVNRRRPSNGADDFSRAEICFDTTRKLPIRYTAYGWGVNSLSAPVLESYTYKHVQVNVGLSEADFDPQNPEYKFP